MPRIPAPGEMSPVIIATGPLTSARCRPTSRAFVGREHLAFFDAISPIVLAETIDMTKVFRRRDGIEVCGRPRPDGVPEPVAGDCGRRRRGRLPELSVHARTSTARFTRPSSSAEKAAVHDFDNTKFFEGCLPIEVMAHRGVDTLRFGPMKPAGPDRSADGPLAVRGGAAAAGQPRRRSLQPRRLSDADEVGRAGARAADDSRASSRPSSSGFGMIHRNTYINGPTVLDRHVADAARGRICSSPARCPASRATSSRRRRA